MIIIAGQRQTNLSDETTNFKTLRWSSILTWKWHTKSYSNTFGWRKGILINKVHPSILSTTSTKQTLLSEDNSPCSYEWIIPFLRNIFIFLHKRLHKIAFYIPIRISETPPLFERAYLLSLTLWGATGNSDITSAAIDKSFVANAYLKQFKSFSLWCPSYKGIMAVRIPRGISPKSTQNGGISVNNGGQDQLYLTLWYQIFVAFSQ